MHKCSVKEKKKKKVRGELVKSEAVQEKRQWVLWLCFMILDVVVEKNDVVSGCFDDQDKSKSWNAAKVYFRSFWRSWGDLSFCIFIIIILTCKNQVTGLLTNWELSLWQVSYCLLLRQNSCFFYLLGLNGTFKNLADNKNISLKIWNSIFTQTF